MKIKIILGDSKGDGHGRKEIFVFESNKTPKEIWDIYKVLCFWSKLRIFDLCEDDNIIKDYVVQHLYNYGRIILNQEDIDNSEFNDVEMDVESFMKLILDFLKLRDVELVEASYKRSELNEIPSLVNYNIGYGLLSL